MNNAEFPFKHRTPIQIRFKDLDKVGHVNNANHLTYFELARMQYSDDVLGKIDWTENGFIVASARIDYRKPILLGDNVFVLTRTSKMGTKSFEMEYQIVKLEEEGTQTTLATGASVMVCINYRTQKTIPIPEPWKKRVTDYEGIQTV
jgi:acyl-CoA thioester hydrolase